MCSVGSFGGGGLGAGTDDFVVDCFDVDGFATAGFRATAFFLFAGGDAMSRRLSSSDVIKSEGSGDSAIDCDPEDSAIESTLTSSS